VEVLATVAERDRLESVLEGWREQCGGARSLTWLRERADRLGERVRVAQLKMVATGAATGATLTAATALELV
jgi:sugar (pentulose or hexulose) kinase